MSKIIIFSGLTGSLSEDLDTSETSIDVSNTGPMYVGQVIKIDSEQLVITELSSQTTIKATRAQNSTSAAVHSNGAAIYSVNQINRVKYLYPDDKTLTVTTTEITVGDPPELIIGDLNSGNSTIVENVTNVPSDYYGDKYDYDSGTWTKRSDWDDSIES